MTDCSKDLFSQISYSDLNRDLTLIDKTYITSVYDDHHVKLKPLFYIYNSGNWDERFIVLEEFLYDVDQFGLGISEIISKDLVIRWGEHELCGYVDCLSRNNDDEWRKYVENAKNRLLLVQGDYYGCDIEVINEYNERAREQEMKDRIELEELGKKEYREKTRYTLS